MRLNKIKWLAAGFALALAAITGMAFLPDATSNFNPNQFAVGGTAAVPWVYIPAGAPMTNQVVWGGATNFGNQVVGGTLTVVGQTMFSNSVQVTDSFISDGPATFRGISVGNNDSYLNFPRVNSSAVGLGWADGSFGGVFRMETNVPAGSLLRINAATTGVESFDTYSLATTNYANRVTAANPFDFGRFDGQAYPCIPQDAYTFEHFAAQPAACYFKTNFFVAFSGKNTAVTNDVIALAYGSGVDYLTILSRPIITNSQPWKVSYVGGPNFYDEGTGTNYLYYFGSAAVGSGETAPASIGVSYSTNMFDWIDYASNPLLTPNANGTNDNNILFRPFVLKNNGVYHMFYNASGKIGNITTERIFHAVGTSPLTITNKLPAVAVGPGALYATNTPYGYGAGDPTIVQCKLGAQDGWLMLYMGFSDASGNGSGSTVQWGGVFRAISLDLTNWVTITNAVYHDPYMPGYTRPTIFRSNGRYATLLDNGNAIFPGAFRNDAETRASRLLLRGNISSAQLFMNADGSGTTLRSGDNYQPFTIEIGHPGSIDIYDPTNSATVVARFWQTVINCSVPVTATSFTGSAGGLTNFSQSQVVTLTGGDQTVQHGLVVQGTDSTTSFIVKQEGTGSQPVQEWEDNGGVVKAAIDSTYRFVGNGGVLTNLNATNISGQITAANLANVSLNASNLVGQLKASNLSDVSLNGSNVVGQIKASNIADVALNLTNAAGTLNNGRLPFGVVTNFDTRNLTNLNTVTVGSLVNTGGVLRVGSLMWSNGIGGVSFCDSIGNLTNVNARAYNATVQFTAPAGSSSTLAYSFGSSSGFYEGGGSGVGVKAAGTMIMYFRPGTQFGIRGNTPFGWSAGDADPDGGVDTTLTRKSAGIIATVSSLHITNTAYIESGLSTAYTFNAATSTGNKTINKPSGSVRIAAAGTSVVLTDSLITTNSVVLANVATHDTTATAVQAVPAAGSCTFFLNAAATAETEIRFMVFDQ